MAVELQPAFSVMAPGDKVRVMVKVKGEGDDISLSANSAEGEGLPEGIKVEFMPPAGKPPLTSVMEVSVSDGVRPATYSFLVVAATPKKEVPAAFVVVVRK
ncbi:MAG: hypothetical protein QW179_04825 [Candidatus Hadarchaeales archaeon]